MDLKLLDPKSEVFRKIFVVLWMSAYPFYLANFKNKCNKIIIELWSKNFSKILGRYSDTQLRKWRFIYVVLPYGNQIAQGLIVNLAYIFL